MLTKIKPNTKNEVGTLVSATLFFLSLVYYFCLTNSITIHDPKIIILIVSGVAMLCFLVAQFLSSFERKEMQRYEIKLQNRFNKISKQAIKSNNQDGRTTLEKPVIAEKETKGQKGERLSAEELLWLQELEIAVAGSLSDFNFTLERLSAEVHLSPRQIRRRLKELTGQKYSEYLREIRMNTALEILESGKVRLIKQVAYEIGMRDVKYFSRQFKSHFGKSPSAYL